MKTIARAMTVGVCLIGAAVLSRCGGSSQAMPPLTISTASVPNGTLYVPYSQAIQASGGVAPFTWTVTAGALPHNVALSGNLTNAVTIAGTPDTAVQGLAFTLTVTDSARQSAAQGYTVSILAEPDTLTLAAAGLSFAPQLTGTPSATQSETISNTGTSAVVISSIALSGANAADFTQSNTCGSSLAADSSCNVNTTFTPSQMGPRSSSIAITDNTMGSPHSFSLAGTGLTQGPDATFSAASLAFYSQTLDTTGTPQSVTMANYGTTTLRISSIATSADYGETTNCGSTLASGASCTIDVTFTPTSTGLLNGTLSIIDGADNSPQSVSLSGTGVAGQCTPVGQECRPGFSCCSGLVCRPYGDRGRCEP